MVTGKGVGGCLPPFSWGKTGPTAFLLGAGGNGKTRPDQKFFLEKLMAQLLLSARIRTVKKVDHVPPSSECPFCVLGHKADGLQHQAFWLWICPVSSLCDLNRTTAD